MSYVDFVNIRMGSDSDPTFSNGNTLPMTTVPFGMNNFTLETRAYAGNTFFNARDRVTSGIRLTHCASRWLGDYGYFSIMPQSEGSKCDPHTLSCFRPEEASLMPYEMRVNFQLHRAEMCIAPTQRGAAGRVYYEGAEGARRFYINFIGQGAELKIDAENHRILGLTRTHHTIVPENFALYFAIQLDRGFDLEKTLVRNGDGDIIPDENGRYKAGSFWAAVALEGEPDEYEFKLATSFISEDQALLNLERELDAKSYEQVRTEAKNIWESLLSKIEIETPDDEVYKTFYSCLYRMFVFPRDFHEVDKDGKTVHYSPMTGEICDGPLYTDNGFWDSYKTVYPLYSIVLSDKYREMCEGFLNFYKECGWLPRWCNPGAVDSMPGTSIDNVFADAVKKGIVTDRKTVELMLESMMKHATTASPETRFGREGIDDYIKYHYVTACHWESVNKTQDYAYGDFSIAVIAKALGKEDIYKEYLDRSLYYRNLFDGDTTFLRARDEEGKMREDWSEFDWGGDYTEGGAWQNSFAMFHDFMGLANLMGGRENMIKKLDRLFDTPPYFNCYGYNHLIHEMSEMAAADFGQCALSNQPSFHIPYLFTYMGDRNKTAKVVRRAVRELFNSSDSGYPGDEDIGSTSGWYVFSALGFYPVCPSIPQYVFGSPIVDRAVIHTDSGKDFIIEADGNSEHSVYWNKAELDGAEIKTAYINHDDIKKGGLLRFEMSSYPAKSEYTDEQLPFSVSKDEI